MLCYITQPSDLFPVRAVGSPLPSITGSSGTLCQTRPGPACRQQHEAEIQQTQPGRADIYPVGPTCPPRTSTSGWPWMRVSFGAGLQAIPIPLRGLAASQHDPGVCCKPLLHQQSPLCPLQCSELCSHTGRAVQTISWHSTGIQPTKLHFFLSSHSNFRF